MDADRRNGSSWVEDRHAAGAPRVAVIGGGLIGCTVAWRIRQALGFDVDLYERRHDILLETSAGTSNRLHYGYQYALSADTATALRHYNHQFKAVYGQCIVPSANYYGVADRSAISPAQYLDFCVRCDLPQERRRPAVFSDRVLLSLLSQESSLDLDALREQCRQKLREHGVEVKLAHASRSMLDTYDYVISAVYGNPNLLQEPARQRDYAFTLCEMMTVALPADYAGLSAMIVYGPFMTVDVLGTTGNHVMYHGQHGVHHVNVGRFADIPAAYHPLLYRSTPAGDLAGLTHAAPALREARRYFEGLDQARHLASTFVVRVQAPSDVSKAVRRTTIEEMRPGWFRISASKLSACVSVADTMIDRLRRRESDRGHPVAVDEAGALPPRGSVAVINPMIASRSSADGRDHSGRYPNSSRRGRETVAASSSSTASASMSAGCSTPQASATLSRSRRSVFT